MLDCNNDGFVCDEDLCRILFELQTLKGIHLVFDDILHVFKQLDRIRASQGRDDYGKMLYKNIEDRVGAASKNGKLVPADPESDQVKRFLKDVRHYQK